MNSALVAFAPLILVVAFAIGYWRGLSHEEDRWRKRTILRGLARYNETTGNWEWK